MRDDQQLRKVSYGEGRELSLLDRFGGWLSSRRIAAVAGIAADADVADFGCGFEARLSRPLAGKVRSLLLMDLSLDPALARIPGVTSVEASLPEGLRPLPSASLDVILCNNVLEHLRAPQAALEEFSRLLRPGGRLFVNVPSWRGKYFLELAAFRLGLAPALEMNDHKMYYDPKDLWPMLVNAGFRPQDIRTGRHKFGLNTYATCTKTDTA
jgi:SAM-dependent methyltransferase